MKDNTEISSINIRPVENGCTVTIETKEPSTNKNSYDGYEYKSVTYNGPSSLVDDILEEIGAEINGEEEMEPEEKKFDVEGFLKKKS